MKITCLTLAAMLAVTGCTSISGQGYRNANAWEACRDVPVGSERQKCIENSHAMQEAELNEWVEEIESDRTRAERSQAELEALGAPPDKAERPHKSGITIPGPY